MLGHKAFFQGSKGLTAGQTYKGGRIKEIGADWVELEVEGKKKKIYVSFAPGASAGSGVGKRGAPGKKAAHGKPGARRSRGVPPGFKLTPQMIEQFKKMPKPMQEKAMQNLPPEIQAQLRKVL